MSTHLSTILKNKFNQAAKTNVADDLGSNQQKQIFYRTQNIFLLLVEFDREIKRTADLSILQKVERYFTSTKTILLLNMADVQCINIRGICPFEHNLIP